MTQNLNNMILPPSIDELMIRYLYRSEGSTPEAVALGEVEPHEVSIGYRTEPRTAWNEGLTSLKLSKLSVDKLPLPPEWGTIVARHDTVYSLVCATGNYPQRVRDLTKLLQSTDLTALASQNESRPVSANLRKWATQQMAKGDVNALVAIGVVRTAGDLDFAEELLIQIKNTLAFEHLSIADNEQAAILWERGNAEAAISIWRDLEETVPVLFNRGMAALFLGEINEARECLQNAIAKLPDSNSWHHLAGLYLSLAEMRITK